LEKDLENLKRRVRTEERECRKLLDDDFSTFLAQAVDALCLHKARKVFQVESLL